MANAITKQDLSSSLSKAVEPILAKFLSQETPKQKAISAKIIAAEKALAKLPDDEVFAPARRAMEGQIEDLRVSKAAAGNGALVKDAVWAMGRAAKSSGLDDQPKVTTAKSGKRRPRIDKDELEAACKTILAKLPSGKSYIAKPELAKLTKLDKTVLSSALAKLGRAGRVKSNGQRGPAGGWQKKAAPKKASKAAA